MLSQLLISHEANRPEAEYAPLRAWLVRRQAAQVLESAWIVSIPTSPTQVLEELRALVHPTDRLFIVELSRAFAWMNPVTDPSEALPA